MAKKNPRWRWEKSFRDADLPAIAKNVGYAIASYADPEGKAWPSIPTLATATGLGESTVRKATKILDENGWVTKWLRPNNSVIYTLTPPLPRSAAPLSEVADPRYHVADPPLPRSAYQTIEQTTISSGPRKGPPDTRDEHRIVGELMQDLEYRTTGLDKQVDAWITDTYQSHWDDLTVAQKYEVIKAVDRGDIAA